MQWNKASEKLPVFDEKGWAHDLLFWDKDTLYSGSCQNRGGNPVFIDWWVGGCDVGAQWWAPWPKKPAQVVPQVHGVCAQGVGCTAPRTEDQRTGEKNMQTKYYPSGNAFSLDDNFSVNLRNKSAVIKLSYAEFKALLLDTANFYNDVVEPRMFNGFLCNKCPNSLCSFNFEKQNTPL